MRFSLYLYTSFHPADDGARAVLELDEQLDVAAESGFAGAWMPEHHAASRFFPPPFTLIPWLAARHRELFFGTLIAISSLYHPLHLAEAIATLDWLTGSRFVIGLGAGFRGAEFAAFGVDPEHRFRLGREAATIVRRLLSGERVTFELGPWRGRDASVAITQTPRPPILWGATSAEAVRAAASVADGILPGALGGFDRQIQALAEFDAAKERVAEWRPLMADIVMGGTPSEARVRAVRSLAAEYTTFTHWRSRFPALEEFVRNPTTGIELIRKQALVGTAHEIGETLAMFAAAGVTDIVLRPKFAGTPQEEVLETISALGDFAQMYREPK